jgi:hypothetical protein
VVGRRGQRVPPAGDAGPALGPVQLEPVEVDPRGQQRRPAVRRVGLGQRLQTGQRLLGPPRPPDGDRLLDLFGAWPRPAGGCDRGRRRGRRRPGRGRPAVGDGAAEVADGEAAEHVLGQLGRGDQQPAAVGEGVVQLGGHPAGQVVAEVDEDVAAQDQVEVEGAAGRRRPGVVGQVQVG